MVVQFSIYRSDFFVVNCDTQEEIDYYWKNLSEDGDPNAQQCGWLKDKFGLSWQVVPTIMADMFADSQSEKSQRVMKAMLQMKKLDIAFLNGHFMVNRKHKSRCRKLSGIRSYVYNSFIFGLAWLVLVKNLINFKHAFLNSIIDGQATFNAIPCGNAQGSALRRKATTINCRKLWQYVFHFSALLIYSKQ
jgi:hypothetical protein